MFSIAIKPRAGLEDVAKRCGLSTVTVSRVINHSESVREYNREKVLKAIAELQYSPNAAARTLAKGKTGVIGMILPSLDDPFFHRLVQAINKYLMCQDMFLAIAITSNEGAEYLFQEQRVDGIMLLVPSCEDEFVPKLKESGLPFVVIDNQKSFVDYCSVLVDNHNGGYIVGKHFLELGHKKIGFIGGPLKLINSAEREYGLKVALNEEDIDIYCSARGEFSFRSGYEIIEKWISQGKLPTAIFAADCNLALGAITALQNNGLKVPLDVSVCGFDEPKFAQEYKPALTTVVQPVDEMAKCATDNLLRLINGEKPDQTTFKFKPNLIIRESTACIF